MSTVEPPLRILTVCTHNRTRSVMTAAMLQSMLDERLGPGGAILGSAGFGPAGLPAIPDAVAAMAARGLDISGHRSRPVTAADIEAADLVLTAEREHVVRVATMTPSGFARAMTLPELLARSDVAISLADEDVGAWIARLTGARTTADYLREHIEEIADPTGSAPRHFEAAVQQMREQCVLAADRIAARRRR